MSDAFPAPEPDDPYSVGDALVAAGRWEAALAEVSAQLAARPGDRRLLGLMLRCLRGLGRRQEAVDVAQQLLIAAPHDPYAFRLATLALLDVGWVDEAIGLAGRAVSLDPSHAANHLALARAWAQSPRRDAVPAQLAAAREAVLLAPNSADAQVQIGVALAAQGDASAAREAYLEALRLEPHNAAALNNLAVLDLRAGATDAAARSLAAALAADPQGAPARRNLDAAAIRILRRMAWWSLLAPIPALVAGAAGAVLLARALVVLALFLPPIVGLRSWRRLAPGQRTYLRSMHRRVRPRTLLWPVLGMLIGAGALVVAWLMPQPGATWLGGYYLLVLALMGIRTMVALEHAGPAGVAADLRIRWQRLASRGGR